jgi:hypothetical protein
MIRAYGYKLLRSPLWLTGILGVAALCCTNFWNYGVFSGDVVKHINVFFNIGVYRKAMTVFAALPFAGNFAEEWTNGVTVSCTVRRGVRRYAAANFFCCFVSALVTVFFGMMLFAGLYALVVPVYKPDGNPYTFIFGKYLTRGQGWRFLILRIGVFSVSCAMWAVVGMLLSVLFPNRYVAIGAPLVASYLIERITLRFPDNLNLWYLSLSLITAKSDWLGFLYCTGIFLIITAVCGIAFVRLVRRRVQNELT